MVRAIVLLGFAIPAIVATLIVIPMLTQPEIPFSAANPNDRIDIEYTKHNITTISNGIIERIVPQKTEILEITHDGDFKYYVIDTEADEIKESKIDVQGRLDENTLKRIIAVIKETGFIAIPTETFKVKENVESYQKYALRVTLNGKTSEVRWLEQNATDGFIPPIITLVESELDQIIKNVNRGN
jgi:hypothetical protein